MIEAEKISISNLNYQQLAEINFWRNAIEIQLGNKEVTLNYGNDDFIKQYKEYSIDFALLELKQAIVNSNSDQITEIQKNLEREKAFTLSV